MTKQCVEVDFPISVYLLIAGASCFLLSLALAVGRVADALLKISEALSK